MSRRSRLVRVNFFHDSHQYQDRQPRTDKGKSYDYYAFGDMPLSVDDVVVVRTYNDDSGPLKFAKVAHITEGTLPGNATRPIICRVPLELIAEQQQMHEAVLRAKKMLKDAAQARTEADLFSEVSGQLSTEERAFVAETLGFVFDKPDDTANSWKSWEFFCKGSTLVVVGTDLAAAQQVAATKFGVIPSLLTFKRL